MKTVLNDLKLYSLILTDAVNMAHYRPVPVLEVVGCEWCYALLVVQARNDDDDSVVVPRGTASASRHNFHCLGLEPWCIGLSLGLQ